MDGIQCIICGVRNSEPEPFSENWVLSCKCGWIHRNCINRTVSNLAATYPGRAIRCAYCFTQLKIEPPTPYIATTIYNFKRRYRNVCNAVAATCCVVAFHTLSVTSGMLSMFFIYGREEVKKLISRDPLFITEICLFTFTSTILICSLPWENNILHFLRRGSHLPVIGRILPIEDPDVKDASIMKDPVVEGLLLPFCAKIIGDLFFSHHDSNLRRYITGGVAFLLAKGLLTMYYTQKMYSIICCMDIENYETENNTN